MFTVEGYHSLNLDEKIGLQSDCFVNPWIPEFA
jgi:hypothetical protein